MSIFINNFNNKNRRGIIMTTTRRSFPFRRHALAVALTLLTGAVNATTINVSGACTLVNAINNANSDADTDGAGRCPAGSGADILNLKANATYTLTAINNTTNGENGLPVSAALSPLTATARLSNAPAMRRPFGCSILWQAAI